MCFKYIVKSPLQSCLFDKVFMAGSDLWSDFPSLLPVEM